MILLYSYVTLTLKLYLYKYLCYLFIKSLPEIDYTVVFFLQVCPFRNSFAVFSQCHHARTLTVALSFQTQPIDLFYFVNLLINHLTMTETSLVQICNIIKCI